jgi:hypothetical protein
VKIPEGQINERTDRPDLTISHMLPMEFFAAQYVEANKLKSGLFVLSGGQFYLAPSGAEWLAGMRPLSDKMAANAQELYDRVHGGVPGDVPTEDIVDILGKDMVDDTAPTALDEDTEP